MFVEQYTLCCRFVGLDITVQLKICLIIFAEVISNGANESIIWHIKYVFVKPYPCRNTATLKFV